ncbi:trans-aconitate methyltransferase 1 [Rhizina undulata]
MATFADANFSHASYAEFRPTYHPDLYTRHILKYHHGGHKLLLDLGCGPGTVTRPLSAHFERTIGADTSQGMLATAEELTPSEEYPNVEYKLSPAEELSFLEEDGVVDLVVSAQAAHWFDYSRFWPEMTRVVRKGGTVAVWGYKDCVLVHWPLASKALAEWAYGKGPERLGDYWEQPGRSIVQGRMRAIDPPAEHWDDVQRWEYEPAFQVPTQEVLAEVEELPEGQGRLVRKGDRLISKKLTLGKVEKYIRTWSCVHAWKRANPERVRVEDGGSGDVVDALFQEMRRVEGGIWGIEDWREIEVELEWGHGVVCARRR